MDHFRAGTVSRREAGNLETAFFLCRDVRLVGIQDSDLRGFIGMVGLRGGWF
jgi:hypothetical protein